MLSVLPAGSQASHHTHPAVRRNTGSQPFIATTTEESPADSANLAMSQSVEYQIIKRMAEAAGLELYEPASLSPARPAGQTTTLQGSSVSANFAVELNTASDHSSSLDLTLHTEITRLQVATDSKGNLSASLTQVTMDFELHASTTPETAVPVIKKTDPLVLDLGSDGFTTTGMHDAVAFDLDADGMAEQCSLPSGNDWLLAMDSNGNHRIDSGAELFGNITGVSDGYAALSALDDNHDGKMNAEDAAWSLLTLVRISRGGEQSHLTLAEAGVRSISLGQCSDQAQTLVSGDEIAATSSFEFENGSTGTSADLLLQSR